MAALESKCSKWSKLTPLLFDSKAKYAMVERLALDRGCKPMVRSVARAVLALPMFSRPAVELFPSWKTEEVGFTVPPGFAPCNPSVVVHGEKLMCSLRTVNYRVTDSSSESEVISDITESRNFLLELDGENLEPLDAKEIICSESGLKSSLHRGLEDLRLFSFEDNLWASFTVLDRHPSGICQIAVSRISDDGRIEKISVQDFEGYRDQKNWMPFVDETGFGWISQCDPTLVLRYDAEQGQVVEWLRWRPGIALENQRGSSQLIPWGSGWLAVTHEMSLLHRRYYLHRFLQFDGNFSLTALTEPFYLEHPGIEFCAGLCRGWEEGKLLLSFGVKDCRAMIAVLSENEVRNALRPCPPSIKLPGPRMHSRGIRA